MKGNAMRRYVWVILGLVLTAVVLGGCSRTSMHVGVGTGFTSKPAPYYYPSYGYTTTTIYHHHRFGPHHRYRHGHIRYGHHGYSGYGHAVRHHHYRAPLHCY